MRLCDQFTRRNDVAVELQCGAALSGIQVLEQSRSIGIGYAAGEWAPPAQRISRRRLDLGHVGTEVDEELRAVRTRNVPGDLDDAQPLQRCRHAGIPMAFGSMYWCRPGSPPPSRPSPLCLN